jgi:hypothetical protein
VLRCSEPRQTIRLHQRNRLRPGGGGCEDGAEAGRRGRSDGGVVATLVVQQRRRIRLGARDAAEAR